MRWSALRRHLRSGPRQRRCRRPRRLGPRDGRDVVGGRRARVLDLADPGRLRRHDARAGDVHGERLRHVDPAQLPPQRPWGRPGDRRRDNQLPDLDRDAVGRLLPLPVRRASYDAARRLHGRLGRRDDDVAADDDRARDDDHHEHDDRHDDEPGNDDEPGLDDAGRPRRQPRQRPRPRRTTTSTVAARSAAEADGAARKAPGNALTHLGDRDAEPRRTGRRGSPRPARQARRPRSRSECARPRSSRCAPLTG